ncbi:hypothetical protein [Variovorax sp. N23]|uniref:hypothetical protein n=1 Tax=Variovorax sp. N23 TaxID=2980555 RepID=UPI0021C896CB|nr:hypothetical protein [Variovorax sp. N23]MCU4120944.1 hypothetical protein [Variovorax sp. N23]
MHDFTMLTSVDDARLPQLFGRHVVAVTVTSIDASSQVHTYSFSGFFVVHNETWFLLMAGHVIEDLRTLALRGETIESWDLTDAFADGPDKRSVVVDIRLDEVDSLPYVQGGSDLAWTAINDFHKETFRRNGIDPIDMARDFERLSDRPFDMLVLAGVPTEKVAFTGARARQALLAIPADVLELEQVSEVLKQGTKRRFYGQLDSVMRMQAGLTDIAGMSGGPLFGLWISPDRKTFDYAVVAIQSAWDPKALQIAGWPLDGVAANLLDPS